jgi:hypothetical protein
MASTESPLCNICNHRHARGENHVLQGQTSQKSSGVERDRRAAASVIQSRKAEAPKNRSDEAVAPKSPSPPSDYASTQSDHPPQSNIIELDAKKEHRRKQVREAVARHRANKRAQALNGHSQPQQA